jgi:zinc finger-containing ubiquitin peptidase 1
MIVETANSRCLVHDFDFRKSPFSNSLIKYVDDYFKCKKPAEGDSTASSCRVSDRPPLYFQHAGHSRTIIGIEHLKSGKINLLLFDPSKSPSSKVKDYAQGKVGKKNLSTDVLKPFRVAMDDIAKKNEYQILRYLSPLMSLTGVVYKTE